LDDNFVDTFQDQAVADVANDDNFDTAVADNFDQVFENEDNVAL
jgi:hypothetical protein